MAFLRRMSRLPNRLKITYSLIALVVIAGIGLFIWSVISGKIKPFAATEEATLTVRTTSPINIGETFSMFITLYNSSGSGISAVNLKYFNYDRAKLEVITVNPDSTGDWDVVTNSVDATTGKIDYAVTAKDTTNGFTGTSSQLISIQLRALASGEAQVWFDYTSNVGDTDVLLLNGSDILTSPQINFVTINSTAASPTPPTSEPTSGSTPHQTPTGCVKGCSPTPTQETTAEPTPTSEESPPEEVSTTTPSPEQIAQVTPTPTPMESILLSPTVSFIPIFTGVSPTATPVLIKLAGFSISKPVAIVLYILIPVLIVGIAFLIWWLRHKKTKIEDDTSSNDEDEDLDDEI